MTAWHYHSNGETEWPITSAKLKELVTSGVITDDSLLRKEDSKWVPAHQVKGLFAVAPPPLQSPPKPRFDKPLPAACVLYGIFSAPVVLFAWSGWEEMGIWTIGFFIATVGMFIAGIGFANGRNWALPVGSFAAICHFGTWGLLLSYTDHAALIFVVPCFVFYSLAPGFLIWVGWGLSIE